MRKANNPYHASRMLVRMSWHPKNLYNLYQRTFGPPAADTIFTRSNRSLYWQRWKSKALLRGYHGDWLSEKRFKAHWLPADLPKVHGKKLGLEEGEDPGEDRTPLTSMMFAELERRLDVAVFRACFAPSVYEARRMVRSGVVKLNGVKCNAAWTRLNAGDMITVEPSAIPMLSPNRLQAQRYGAPTVEDGVTAKAKRQAALEEASAKISQFAGESVEAVVSSASSPEPVPTSIDRTADQPKAAAEAEGAGPAPPRPGKAASLAEPLPFILPAYASPFLFLPANLEVSFRTCSFIYLRPPTCGPGYSEVPTPWNADGEIFRLAWEFYARRGLGRRVRKERKEKDSRRREESDPFAEWWLRKASAGGRVGMAGRAPEGARVGIARKGPQGDPRYYAPAVRTTSQSAR